VKEPAGTAHFSVAIVLSSSSCLRRWAAGLTAMICLVGLFLGVAVGLPPASGQIVAQSGLSLALAGLPDHRAHRAMAFFASAGHGYLPAMGLCLRFCSWRRSWPLRWGEYFPWSIPILISQGDHLGAASYVIVVLTSAAGRRRHHPLGGWQIQAH